MLIRSYTNKNQTKSVGLQSNVCLSSERHNRPTQQRLTTTNIATPRAEPRVEEKPRTARDQDGEAQTTVGHLSVRETSQARTHGIPASTMKAKSRGAQRASKRKKSQQPARGKGTPGMTRMCSGTTTVCYQGVVAAALVVGGFTASLAAAAAAGSPAFCTAAADERVIARLPASPPSLGGKGLPDPSVTDWKSSRQILMKPFPVALNLGEIE